MKFTITGNGYSGNFNGENNFKATARRMLIDKGFKDADFFKMKTVEDYIAALSEKGYKVKTERTVYDAAKDEAPHLGKYLNEMEAEEDEGRIPASAQITKIKIGKDEKMRQFYIKKTVQRLQKK